MDSTQLPKRDPAENTLTILMEKLKKDIYKFCDEHPETQIVEVLGVLASLSAEFSFEALERSRNKPPQGAAGDDTPDFLK